MIGNKKGKNRVGTRDADHEEEEEEDNQWLLQQQRPPPTRTCPTQCHPLSSLLSLRLCVVTPFAKGYLAFSSGLQSIGVVSLPRHQVSDIIVS